MSEPVELGVVVKDRYTDFEGVVVARTDYLHDTPQGGIQARALHDGRPIPVQWIDETRGGVPPEERVATA